MNATHLDSRFITLFLDSFQTVFNRVFDCDLCKGPVSVLGRKNGHHTVAIMTGVVGTHHTGMVVYRMKDQTAKRMVEYLDPTMSEFQETIYEGLGEVVNIVSGNAVQHFSRNQIELAITTLSVVAGNPLQMHLLNQTAYSITLLSPFGEIGIDIAIKQF